MIKNNFIIRTMQTADLSAVLLIEQEQAFPWTIGMLQDCLKANYECRVMENAGEIIGFSILIIGLEQAELLNIVIKAAYQQRGHGQKLLTYMLEIAKKAGAVEVMLEVRVSNVAALGLYKRAGFSQIGVRKKYYPTQSGREDALVLKILL